MRATVTILLIGAALWRAGLDWQATIAQGYAYRFATPGGLISAAWPRNYAALVEGLERSGVPYAWNPVGALVMSLPIALVLAAIGVGLWITRERGRVR
jgi:hypothetical protein